MLNANQLLVPIQKPNLQLSSQKKRQRMKQLFVSRFEPDMNESDIGDIIKSSLDIRYSVSKLKTKFPTYSSFVVEYDFNEGDDILNPSVWPEGTLMRRFFPKKDA